MAVKKPEQAKKYYSVAEANATLPLVRAIVQDITDLAGDLQERYDRLSRLAPPGRQGKPTGGAWEEEIRQMRDEFERDQGRMHGYEDELQRLGVELKDYNTGLIDFPCWMNNHEVCLCWKLGEPEIAFWHENDAGFAGRQRLPSSAKDPKPESRLLASDN